MVRSILVLLLVAAVVASVRLARAAADHKRERRAAEAYGLAGDRRVTRLLGAGSVAAGLCALVLLLALGTGASNRLRFSTGGPPAAAAAAVAGRPGDRTPATGDPATATPAFATIGHPAGGRLLQGTVGAADGSRRVVRVWLPPQYAEDTRTGFPVVVLQTGSPGSTADVAAPYVFDGFTSAATQQGAGPFVVVAPQAPAGTEHPCELLTAAPGAVPDDTAVRAAVAAGFRTLPPGPRGWETLGIGDAAPCAAAAALTRPDLYGAGAALSGRYDSEALVRAAADGAAGLPDSRLLLAATRRDLTGREEVGRLRDALASGDGRAARVVVATSETVRDAAVEQERILLVRMAVRYLAKSLGTPAPGASAHA
ncbi:hypothetical protein [Peterkaempfera griseoplana]|uniref:hypothetical protein n=1 Tax=Peterkaempfera griseoplana TaxID=66896 RepID=UPI000B09B706|nr:hypothetical protein [Peterkaempfera griseoplana]